MTEYIKENVKTYLLSTVRLRRNRRETRRRGGGGEEERNRFRIAEPSPLTG
jgi:hypothetical protein